MVYNLADTFFIGQIGNPVMVAAVSLVSPWFNLLTALGNLFGLGGQQPHLPDAGGPEPPGRQACGGLQCVGRQGDHPLFSLATHLGPGASADFRGQSDTDGYAESHSSGV